MLTVRTTIYSNYLILICDADHQSEITSERKRKRDQEDEKANEEKEQEKKKRKIEKEDQRKKEIEQRAKQATAKQRNAVQSPSFNGYLKAIGVTESL